MLFCFCLQALAQDVESDDDTQFAAIVEGTVAPEIPQNLTDVVVLLHNGVVLKGSVNLTELLVWVPGPELTFVPEGGDQMTLAGEMIVSVQSADAEVNVDPRSTWDFGLVMLASSENDFLGPLPWVDYTWHFGSGRTP